jgi:putative copper export protein/mono/diheme cytochrome c family protein
MLDALARFAWQSAAVLALGAALFWWRSGAIPPPLQPWARRAWRLLPWTTALGLVAGVLVLDGHAERILGHAAGHDWTPWQRLVLGTRLGQMWLVKQTMLLVAMAVLLPWREPRRGALLALLIVSTGFFLAGARAGHGGVGEPLALFLPLHTVHAWLSAAWLGGLPLWGSLVLAAGDSAPQRDYVLHALRRFSRFALTAMLLLIVSGTLIAWRQFGAWPALFATEAAALLWIKLALLAVVLMAAWHLRATQLARLERHYAADTRRAVLRVFGIELLAALALFGFALALAQGTPGAHQALDWWLPFRLQPALLGASSFAQWQVVLAASLLSCVAPAWWLRYRALAVLLLLGATLIGVQAMAVRAFPTTYLRAGVPYDAHSIARGMTLFAAHCADCHGSGARGDGAQSLTTSVPPADLARHTALHSGGDMFAWLSNGTPSGAMPGFAAVLDASARWDLINMLRAFADGHRARVIDEQIKAGRAWLAAPNFRFESATGRRGELKDWRGERAVLVYIARDGAARDTLHALADAPALRGAPLEMLVAPAAGDCRALGVNAERVHCLSGGGEAVTAAYGLLSRSLVHAGSRDSLSGNEGDAAFLVDRFGFIRARWLARDGAPCWSPAQLAQTVATLAAEPALRPAPETHVH